eukprot:112425_1
MSKFATLFVFWIVIAGTTAASTDAKSSSEVAGHENVDFEDFDNYFDNFEESAEDTLSLYADGNGDYRSTHLTPLTPKFLTASMDRVLDGFRMICLMELLDHKRLSELRESDVEWFGMIEMTIKLDKYIDAILTWVDRQKAKSLGNSPSEQKTKLTEDLKTVLDYLKEKFNKHNKSIDTFPKQGGDFWEFVQKKLDLEDFRTNHTSGEDKIIWFKDNLREIIRDNAKLLETAVIPAGLQSPTDLDLRRIDKFFETLETRVDASKDSSVFSIELRMDSLDKLHSEYAGNQDVPTVDNLNKFHATFETIKKLRWDLIRRFEALVLASEDHDLIGFQDQMQTLLGSKTKYIYDINSRIDTLTGVFVPQILLAMHKSMEPVTSPENKDLEFEARKDSYGEALTLFRGARSLQKLIDEWPKTIEKEWERKLLIKAEVAKADDIDTPEPSVTEKVAKEESPTVPTSNDFHLFDDMLTPLLIVVMLLCFFFVMYNIFL